MKVRVPRGWRGAALVFLEIDTLQVDTHGHAPDGQRLPKSGREAYQPQSRGVPEQVIGGGGAFNGGGAEFGYQQRSQVRFHDSCIIG
jgi:hypothetical protein